MNDKNALEHRLGYRFSILSTLNVRFAAGHYTRKFGLSAAGWRILSIIGRHQPIFPKVAAELSTMDADKVTRAVDRLVDLKYVVRNADAADRRRVILCLSPRGRGVYEEVEELMQQLDAQWRSALTAQEGKVFDGLLDKLDARARELFVGSAADRLGELAAARKRSARAAREEPARRVRGNGVRP